MAMGIVFKAILQFLVYSLGIFVLVGAQGTKVGFYSSTCPKAESIVTSTVKTHFNADQTIAAGLLRLFFHDCFVQGCDASILITGPSAEKNSLTNLGLRGFEVVEDAKTQVEAACPGVVSCADILALASRDAVVLSKGPTWGVPTGRRDGLVSSSSDAANLPTPADSVTVQKQKFADKGLTTEDLVTLVGAHTIGQTDCQFFSYRLYNFTTTGNADPTISSSYLSQLQSLCPSGGDGSKRVALDKGSQLNFDDSFFKNVRDGNAVLESDQRLWGDASTKSVVQKYAGTIRGVLGLRFDLAFAKAMVKLSNVGVKTGSDGEIRKVCSAFN
ncbi:peroxidase 25-like [Cryptomeria japonica]|uniref:peroxidase 25-like n=1 Tax=Cryptomeria japonica TaxID=3369 RepID=UPI0027DAB447|nr:peroxidase 25-like [Cryptomeria japonica]